MLTSTRGSGVQTKKEILGFVYMLCVFIIAGCDGLLCVHHLLTSSHICFRNVYGIVYLSAEYAVDNMSFFIQAMANIIPLDSIFHYCQHFVTSMCPIVSYCQ